MAEEQIIYRNKVPRYTVKKVIDDDGNESTVYTFPVPDGIDPVAYAKLIEEEVDRAFPEVLAKAGQYMHCGLILDDPFALSQEALPANGVPMGWSGCIAEVTEFPEHMRDFIAANPALGEKNT